MVIERSELISAMQRERLVAVVRSKTSELAIETAIVAADAGVKFVEITFSVPGAIDVITTLAKRPDLHVGAGTVLSKEQAEQAIGAGSAFIVSPTLELNLIPLCHRADIACFPGAATPTEIFTAFRAGADLVKIFPADLVGGVDFIRQISGPFPEVRFMVSGGVTLSNVKDYVWAGVTGICLGSAYLGNLLEQKGRVGFVNEVKEFVRAVTETGAK
jgi:2-dehydro-3-deoxyphosphogluconate aldolase / (4S)-4-hydroxy-2-oxoglutarate aldolase